MFDLIARRFIAVFYPDCKFSTTTVTGEADSIEFKVSGKQILDPDGESFSPKIRKKKARKGKKKVYCRPSAREKAVRTSLS